MSRSFQASAPAGAARPPVSGLDALCDAVRRWMFEAALPFWSADGVDVGDGGFVEKFDLQGRPCNVVKRVRVVCRQTYVFSHAAVLGWPGGLEAAERGWRYLLDKAWQGEDGGFARTLGPDGRVLDPTPDLYDHAFALFAFAWRHRATGDPEALAWAHRTLDVVERRLRPAEGRGFLADAAAARERLQNPHMHLLEAALALVETSGEHRFVALADELATLFHERLYDPATRTLAEHFDADWRRLPQPSRRLVEPGHQFEWAWILTQHQRLTGRDNREAVRGLVGFAEEHGVDRTTGAVTNVLTEAGEVLDGGSRTWPNTERMKAAVALYDLDGDDPVDRLVSSGRLLLDRYLSGPFAAGWLDAFDAEGRPTVEWVPASTLYHLFLAFAETLRVQEAMERTRGETRR